MTAKKSNKTSKPVSRNSVTSDDQSEEQKIDQEFVDDELEQASDNNEKKVNEHAEKLKAKRERWSKMNKEEIIAERKARIKNQYAKLKEQPKDSGTGKGGETQEDSEG